MIQNNKTYKNKLLTDITLSETEIENSIFESCNFTHCNFDNIQFNKCKFNDCRFQSCALNLIKLMGSSFIETDFVDCKMKGINWTALHFPYVTLTSPVFFDNCDISYSSFYELKLPNITIINCKAHEVDFRTADLSHSDLSGTDFKYSLFNQTNLKSSDLRQSINYHIDPTENALKDAQFSLPEAISLLTSFKIKIDE